MKIFIVTLFPEVIQPYLSTSIMKKAREAGRVSFSIVDLRPFGLGKHKQVDDYPYGGGPGMILRPEPVFSAADEVIKRHGEKPHIIVVTPRGKLFRQEDARRLAEFESLLIVCGHYEGIDERISVGLADEEISIGDYVLTGGELPGLVLIDSVVRLLTGVLPEASIQEESFSGNLLEHPQYTRPPEFRGMKVPDVLLSGDHGSIRQWRREHALRRTVSRSKELILHANPTAEEKIFAAKLREESKDHESHKNS